MLLVVAAASWANEKAKSDIIAPLGVTLFTIHTDQNKQVPCTSSKTFVAPPPFRLTQNSQPDSRVFIYFKSGHRFYFDT